MNKTTYILLLLATVISAACGKHIHDIDHQGSQTQTNAYVFFDPEVIEVVQTKTHIVEGDKLPTAANTAFGVLGIYNSIWLFEDYTDNIAKVYRETDGALFDYDNLSPWPDATADYIFYAFYPYSIYNEVVVGANNIPYIQYTQPTDVADMKDILTATKQTKKTDLVKPEFSHRLWALDVKVKNSQQENVPYYPNGTDQTLSPTLYITEAKIYVKGFYKNGKISLTGPVADTQISADIFEYDIATSSSDIAVPSSTTIALEPLLFLPVKNTLAYRLELKLKNAWGASYDFSYPSPTSDNSGNILYSYITLSNMDFKAGYRYSLILEKKETPGDFSINWDVNGWGIQEDVNHTFN